MALTNSNTINTRIQLKYDTYENWLASTLEILPGEMCVALVNLGQNENAGATINENNSQVGYKPTILIKIGDGIKIEDSETHEQRYKYFNELDYIQTKAGDVYGWAKAATAPTANDLIIGGNGEDANITIKSKIDTIVGGLSTDTNTKYKIESGTGDNVGKIRLFSQDGTIVNNTNWTPEGDWITVGQAISIAAHGVTASAGEVVVLTGITADNNEITPTATTLYTKNQIDNLINPGMEFKGVLSATNTTFTSSDLPVGANVLKGDSYKINVAGTVDAENSSTIEVKAGDLIIAVKDNPLQQIDNVNWAIIPAGNESFEDTWRPIKYKDYQHDNENPTSVINLNNLKALEIDAGQGINLSHTEGTNNVLNINVDTNIIATKNYVDAKTLNVANLTQDSTYLIFNCGNASGWTS